jgi:hypothetical protein
VRVEDTPPSKKRKRDVPWHGCSRRNPCNSGKQDQEEIAWEHEPLLPYRVRNGKGVGAGPSVAFVEAGGRALDRDVEKKKQLHPEKRSEKRLRG